jgi:nitrate/TMAO reductase-like tetraheme cytochrome c subunit
MSKSGNNQKDRRLKTSPILIALLAAFGLAVILPASGFAFAATQETHDSFCSSCHTQPESTFFQRSVDTQPVDLASAHKADNTRCIDCHSGKGVTGRIRAELLGAHNALAFYTRTAVQPAKLTRPIGDDSCLKCHQNVTTQRGRNNHFHGFLARWQAADPNAGTCVSCHGGHTTDGSAQPRFMNDANTRLVCDSCHRVLREGE